MSRTGMSAAVRRRASSIAWRDAALSSSAARLRASVIEVILSAMSSIPTIGELEVEVDGDALERNVFGCCDVLASHLGRR